MLNLLQDQTKSIVLKIRPLNRVLAPPITILGKKMHSEVHFFLFMNKQLICLGIEIFFVELCSNATATC